MSAQSNTIGLTARIAARFGRLLMGFVARKDLRVRYVIANAASRARAGQLARRSE